MVHLYTMRSAIAGIFLSAAVAFGGQIYTVEVIPVPSGFTAVNMSSINTSGQVAGFGTTGGITQAFLGSPSGSMAIPLPSGFTQSWGMAINGSGQVVGYGSNGTTTQAFIGTPSGSTAIPLPSGWTWAEGLAVNSSGQVAGDLNNGSTYQAFIGTTSGSVAIPFPSGGMIFAYGLALNDSGQVAGSFYNGTIFQAFIGTSSASTLIPLPSGWSSADGQAINDSGQVAGYGENGTVQQAFIGTVAGSTGIPLPVGATYANLLGFGSLNNLGVVVGESSLGGWIWDAADGTQLLNSLVPPGWSLSSANAISDNGLILAYGSFDGGPAEFVELDPVPEPGTYSSVGAGLLVLAMARKRLSASSNKSNN
jgi:hypothetical protein